MHIFLSEYIYIIILRYVVQKLYMATNCLSIANLRSTYLLLFIQLFFQAESYKLNEPHMKIKSKYEITWIALCNVLQEIS